MKMIKVNEDQCMVASWAMALSTTIDTLVEEIGVDGREWVWPEAGTTPAKRRSHHPLEFYHSCLKRNKIPVYVINRPGLSPGTNYEPIEIVYSVPDYKRAVLMDNTHAVAYDGTYYYDPADGIKKDTFDWRIGWALIDLITLNTMHKDIVINEIV